jgi:hypothetical protein
MEVNDFLVEIVTVGDREQIRVRGELDLALPTSDRDRINPLGVHDPTATARRLSRQMAGRALTCEHEHEFVTSQGSPSGRFQRALDRGNLLEADSPARELRRLTLLDALEFCDLLARQAPERYERAALRWHGRWETKAKASSLAESQLALHCFQLLTSDHRAVALSLLRHMAKR